MALGYGLLLLNTAATEAAYPCRICHKKYAMCDGLCLFCGDPNPNPHKAKFFTSKAEQHRIPSVPPAEEAMAAAERIYPCGWCLKKNCVAEKDGVCESCLQEVKASSLKKVSSPTKGQQKVLSNAAEKRFQGILEVLREKSALLLDPERSYFLEDYILARCSDIVKRQMERVEELLDKKTFDKKLKKQQEEINGKIFEEIDVLTRCMDARVSQIEQTYGEQSVTLHTADDLVNAITDLASYVPETTLQDPAKKQLICCGLFYQFWATLWETKDFYPADGHLFHLHNGELQWIVGKCDEDLPNSREITSPQVKKIEQKGSMFEFIQEFQPAGVLPEEVIASSNPALVRIYRALEAKLIHPPADKPEFSNMFAIYQALGVFYLNTEQVNHVLAGLLNFIHNQGLCLAFVGDQMDLVPAQ